MTEDKVDSSGPSPLIKGEKKVEWILLVSRFDLEDALNLLGKVEGSRFTQQDALG